MQVFEHVESKQRQYALADRARGLGWSSSSIEIIDEDQGKSGATTEGRHGFARLAHAVAHGEAGAVFALEVSRLARSSEDWQRLLALCAVADVVVVDEQSVYDPANKDDKLLLDLKGTMSEAELHWLGLRLQGGRRHKARRGELRLSAPTGYVWGGRGFILDPDESVQRAVRLVFERFAIEPSACAVVRWANEVGFKFPSRLAGREAPDEVTWSPLTIGRIRDVLHNPTYAGVYVYGRRPTKKVLVDGDIRVKRMTGDDPNEWWVRLEDQHPAYIDWETYVNNRKKLRANLSEGHPTTGAPREGRALLTGLLLCGRCGRRMQTDYATGTRAKWFYLCHGEHARSMRNCWSVPGAPLDAAVESIFLERMTPKELDVSLAVEKEVEHQADTLAQQWRTRLELVQYEARRAERRYKLVDPDNRVVARTLEREWEQRLRDVEEVERQYQDARRVKRVELSEEDRQRIRALAKDVPLIWRSPTTHSSDRKAMLRLVMEIITLTPIDVPRRETMICVQWKSGNVTETRVARQAKWNTSDVALERIRELTGKGLRDREIAARLNEQKLTTGSNRAWTKIAVRRIRNRHLIPPGGPRIFTPIFPARDANTGEYSVPGAAKAFDVSRRLVRYWIEKGLVDSRVERFGRRFVTWVRIDDRMARRLRERGRVPSTDVLTPRATPLLQTKR
jgi:DNA invertase Pin-like site-specific DNA recombinase